MSEDKDTTSTEFTLTAPLSREEERKAKACARMRAYREANPEKVKATVKASRQKHKEKIAAHRKVYASENKENIAARRKPVSGRYDEANKEKIRERNRKGMRPIKREHGWDFAGTVLRKNMASRRMLTTRCLRNKITDVLSAKSPLDFGFGTQRPHVDHWHKTGEVRAIFCHDAIPSLAKRTTILRFSGRAFAR